MRTDIPSNNIHVPTYDVYSNVYTKIYGVGFQLSFHLPQRVSDSLLAIRLPLAKLVLTCNVPFLFVCVSNKQFIYVYMYILKRSLVL